MFLYSPIEKAYFNTDMLTNLYVRLKKESGVYVISGEFMGDHMSVAVRVDFVQVPIGENPDEFLKHTINQIINEIRGRRL